MVGGAGEFGYTNAMKLKTRGLIAFRTRVKLNREQVEVVREQMDQLARRLGVDAAGVFVTEDLEVRYLPAEEVERGFSLRRKLSLGERIRLLFTG